MGVELRRLTGDDAKLYTYVVRSQVVGLLSADLVTSNVITTTVTLNGTALTPVATTFSVDHDTTMAAHIAALAALSGVTAVAGSDANGRSFIITGDDANDIVSATSVVTLGASQATVALDSDSSADTNQVAPGAWVKIIAKSHATTGMFGELSVGDLYYNASAVAQPVTPGAAGDEWRLLTLGDMLDLAGWSLEITAERIDVTVAADTVRKYRNGKRDANGSASFVFVKGISDDATAGLMKSFFKIVQFSNNGTTIDVTPIDTGTFLLLAYMDATDDEAGSYKLATAFEVEFEGFPLNFRMSEAANLDINFHLVGSTNPTVYKLNN